MTLSRELTTTHTVPRRGRDPKGFQGQRPLMGLWVLGAGEPAVAAPPSPATKGGIARFDTWRTTLTGSPLRAGAFPGVSSQSLLHRPATHGHAFGVKTGRSRIVGKECRSAEDLHGYARATASARSVLVEDSRHGVPAHPRHHPLALKWSRLIWMYLFHSSGRSSCGKMAFTGHSSTHRPQSMQVSGSM